MSSPLQQIYEQIDQYGDLRDKLQVTRYPETAHTVALRASRILLWLLRNDPTPLGDTVIAKIREQIHFPELSSRLAEKKYTLGPLELDSPFIVPAGYFKDPRTIPYEFLGVDGGWQVGGVEFGGITLDPQQGNPGVRLATFPYQKARGAGASINRFGLNNIGAHKSSQALREARESGRIPQSVKVIVNICNGLATSPERKPFEMERIAQLHAPYIDGATCNISCPNQAGARELGEKIGLLRSTLQGVREMVQNKLLILKLSPDSDEPTLERIIEASHDLVDAYCSSNTTTNPAIRRQILREAGYGEQDVLSPLLEKGGIGGTPLLDEQCRVTGIVSRLTNKDIFAVGGIGAPGSIRKTLYAGNGHVKAIGALTSFAQYGPAMVGMILTKFLAIQKEIQR